MNEAQQRLLVRNAILLDLHAASPASLPASTLLSSLRQVHELPCDVAVFDKHVGYLIGKGLVEKTSSQLSAGNVRYKLTAEGIEHLESENLV